MTTVVENVSLRKLNTFGIDVKASYYSEIQSPEAFQGLLSLPVYRHNRKLILGSGSNVLFTKDFDGLVLASAIKGIEIIQENDDYVVLKAGSGENWHGVVMHCVNHLWGGIENLSLIPGTCGAAPMQNIGAYGVEIKNVIENVNGIDLDTGHERTFNNSECQFSYRESVFKQALKEKYFISSITLRLTKKNHHFNTQYGAIKDMLKQKNIDVPTLRDISDAVISIRQSKLPDPSVIGNAGSFFKNPTLTQNAFAELKHAYPTIPSYPSDNQNVKVAAGWLIEQCGWKGKKLGNVGVHPHQALVLVNYGGGKGEEILELAKKIQASVSEKFSIALTTEVNIF
ncbi:MAG TPA: UDP-N-acetylmuramate dehydrogenase [Cyclobacteriaceae bacterium]|nr:UDP-N-acetylmuramate dehydrogenase [Cyclobacteriaceae bacterium]